MAIRLSNNVTRVVTLLTLLLSAAVLGAGVRLRYSRADAGTGSCDRSLSTAAIALGAALTAAALAGLAAAFCRATWLLWLYLLAMLALIAALLCLTAFAFAVTDDAMAARADGRRVGGFRYSTWLRRHVEARATWARIRACLADARVCRGMEANATGLAPLGPSSSPVESGCCRPPAGCNFTYASGAGRDVKAAGVASGSADPADCGAWGDDGDELCYGCQSCKNGVVAALRRDWRRAAIVNAVFLAVIVVLYSISCCAFRNSRLDNYSYHSGSRWKQSGDA
ncbi:hypothetical protein U9M48_038743 [Paspalum notatum var. saurae]|uniref:Uncharacterized protein n=1 Tax=Paspalum notatum var. saurae TaxID=547442 RepID=A0AAQ3XDV9_PASNO